MDKYVYLLIDWQNYYGFKYIFSVQVSIALAKIYSSISKKQISAIIDELVKSLNFDFCSL